MHAISQTLEFGCAILVVQQTILSFTEKRQNFKQLEFIFFYFLGTMLRKKK